jgi:hypothetical protein
MQSACPILRILSSVACLALQNFSILFHKRHAFQKKLLTCNVCFDFPYSFSHSKKNFSEILLQIYVVIHVKYPLFLSDINANLIFSTDFRKIDTYQILWKSVQWKPVCSMRTDRRTDGRTDGRTDRQTDRQTDRHEKLNRRFSQCGQSA